MKTLYVLRHAKSDWGTDGLDDRDRPLAPRGRHAASKLAEHLREAAVRPAVVLCSPALRARETLDGVRDSLGGAEVLIEDELYGAGASTLLDRVRRLSPALPSAMIVGHNPGLHELVLELAADGDADVLARVRAKFPTGALATLLLPGDWVDAGDGGGTLSSLIVPRDLD